MSNFIDPSMLPTYLQQFGGFRCIFWDTLEECLAAVIGAIRVALIFSKLNYSLLPSLKIKRQYIYNRTLLTTGKNFDIGLSLSLDNNLTITRQCYS